VLFAPKKSVNKILLRMSNALIPSVCLFGKVVTMNLADGLEQHVLVVIFFG
jgi:hypothetical protein